MNVLSTLFGSDHAHTITEKDAIDLHKWIAAPRIATLVLSVGFVSYLWYQGNINFNPVPLLFVVLPLFLGACGLISILVKERIKVVALLPIQIAIDTLGVTAGIFVTGGAHSPFVGLYILAVISAGIVSMRTAIGIGMLSIILFSGMAFFGDPIALGLLTNYTQSDLITFIVFILIIVLVAFQSQFYAQRIREKDEELLKLKDEFLFRTTHDLRSPSTVIKLVLEKYNDPKIFARFPEAKDDILIMQETLDRMMTLITDILKIGKGEESAFVVKKDPINIAEIMTATIAELGPRIKEKQIEIHHQTENARVVLADKEKLREALNNFIENATKYNRDGGSISISYRANKSTLDIIIQDTGLDISKESLSKLFTAYFRGDMATSNIKGTGLGLYMTKRLVEKMSGGVTVASEQGKGTTFTVSLPLASNAR